MSPGHEEKIRVAISNALLGFLMPLEPKTHFVS
jgi:hypothetical protein